MKDVADEVGVSVMTVSAVLAGRATNVRVSERTRARVVETARRLNYRPNAVARSLRRRKTDLLGVYCGYGYFDARNAFYAEVIGGLQAGCGAHRKDLLLHGIFRGRSVDDIYAEMIDGRVDGLVVMAPQDDALAARLADSHLPAIAVVDALSCLPSVVADDAGGSRALARHLAGRGHRRALYLGTTMHLVSAERRRAAFMTEAAGLGLCVEEWRAGYDADAEQYARALSLGAPISSRPTAVACWNDDTARTLISHLNHFGVSVPSDVAVVGFDGYLGELTGLNLTTVRAPWAEVARTAVDLLVGLAEGKPAPAETVLPVELVAGATA